jgi:hypothetical protein
MLLKQIRRLIQGLKGSHNTTDVPLVLKNFPNPWSKSITYSQWLIQQRDSKTGIHLLEDYFAIGKISKCYVSLATKQKQRKKTNPMKIDIPIRNPNGSLSATFTADEKQVQALLEFALNFMVMSGLTAQFGIVVDNGKEQIPLEFND